MAKIFDLGNTPKVLTEPNQHLFDIFLAKFNILYLSEELPNRLVSWVIFNQFLELFSAVGFIL